MQEYNWNNLSETQSKVLSATEKLSKMEGVFVGWYYAALMSDNKSAAQVAYDMSAVAGHAMQLVCEISNKALAAEGKAKNES